VQVGFNVICFRILTHHLMLSAGKPVHIANKNLIDYIFLKNLEVAQSYDLPIQIQTG